MGTMIFDRASAETARGAQQLTSELIMAICEKQGHRLSSAFKSEYDRLIANHRIVQERDQDVVVAALDRLSLEIAAAKNCHGLFGRENASRLKGVYIWGHVGRGKSMLMNMFFEHAEVSKKQRAHFHAFMQEVHAAMQPPGEEGKAPRDPVSQAAIALWQDAHLLCLDELEIVDIADAMIVGRLFERMFEKGLVLVATSNNHPDELYHNGANRELFVPFIEQLKAHMDVVELGGTHDHRSDRDEEDATYLSPITPETAQRFDRLWHRVLNNEKERRATIGVHGRDIRFGRSCGPHLRVTFGEVCEQPFSADDHLAIAGRFSSVFLENVPIIPDDQVDEGRRLVTLIDALYESKAQLTVLAAAPPEDIFEQASSEDQYRTISRLNEMKGQKWSGHGNRAKVLET